MTMTAVTTRRHLGGATVALAAATMTATTMTATTMAAGSAHAAPIAVQQIPANGIVSNGITDFGTYAAAIRIDTASPGVVWFSAPAGGRCGNPAIDDSFVRFDYRNAATGRAGSAMVRPCPGPWSGSRRVKLFTGRGPVSGTVNIVNRGGPWQVPGWASFTAP
ncbi:MAG TPA: hypothetical protein PK331_17165 [Gordonia sp. (in: high G+C Gram-positive bacteria)]|uniref:hypothetical protein n=1 Tax=unclassified Gordonia (in: high G+C Gram-positive bacteria) TaxID=2657482 RepID=UPI0025BBE84F|nr:MULTISPECIES: hypothetical protein [unclassified Gordonia (in: high G+C Gram-positive bacteria)]HNP55660.1 hypothetical protein [Gordonia sp. (in: high G+C Gram-positive bacteria)]HRC52635.1 hypothetical protein [Gordonia sp. (in: high G+C Gram-positive bacteria)]